MSNAAAAAANADGTYDRVNDYTSVKISLARPQDIDLGRWRSQEAGNHQLSYVSAPKKTVCSANAFLALRKTGNAPAVSIAG